MMVCVVWVGVLLLIVFIDFVMNVCCVLVKLVCVVYVVLIVVVRLLICVIMGL